MEPFVSVVVPAYNEEKYLGSCLKALKRQTCAPDRYEVIVVDNGSADATGVIAQSHNVRVVLEARKGVAQARHTGFLEARGSIIASTDADTIVAHDWVERITSHFCSVPTLGGVYGPVYWHDGSPLARWLLRYPVTVGLAVSNGLARSLWWGSNFAVRKDVFLEVGGFPINFGAGEDTDLSLRVNRVARVRFDPELVVFTSSRRIREGYGSVIYSTLDHLAERFLLRRPPKPIADIR